MTATPGENNYDNDKTDARNREDRASYLTFGLHYYLHEMYFFFVFLSLAEYVKKYSVKCANKIFASSLLLGNSTD